MAWLTAREALEILNVRKRTLYTYASRGWVQTRALDGRRKLYRRADVERLRDNALAHRGQAARSRAALAWGEPVLTTAISGIDRDGPYYRGVPAVDLVDRPLQEVAEHLWGHTGPWPSPRVAPGNGDLTELRRQIDALPRLEGDAAFRHITVNVWAWADLPSHPDLDAARVLCADHGLNPSTFTARLAASTGSDPYAWVVAALATFSGPRHGMASVELAERLQDPTWCPPGPGFDHPLYPDGDPRGEGLLDRCPPKGRLEEAVRQGRRSGHLPTVDAGLLAVTEALGLPAVAAPLLFVSGRVLGWLAHGAEQSETPGPLRPRGRFEGWVQD